MFRLLLLSLSLVISANAFGDFPRMPIKAVVTFPPGGPADVMARMIQPALEKNLGKPVVIENRPGDGGALGFTQVSKADPDGHTILLTTSAPLTLGTAMRNLSFSLDSFEYLGAYGGDSTAIVSRPDQQWKDLDQLLQHAKSNPDKISYATPGSATAPFLTMEAIRSERNVAMTGIHFKGTGPVVTAVLGGHTQFGVSGFASVKEMIRQKKLIVLAVTGQTRHADFPDVPTLEEKGLLAGNIDLWSGAWAPKGTPKEVLALLSKALEQAAKDPGVSERFRSGGYKAFWLPEAQMRELAKKDHERATKVVKLLGIGK